MFLLLADSSAVAPFREELEKVMADEGYSRDQLFNADETGLWWRLTPTSSLNSGGTRSSNFKKAKDRVTMMACSNASGTFRLPLVMINKSSKPRCFKHMDMNALPVHYFAQKKSWMDCQTFQKWFNECFIPSVKKFCREKGLEEKVLLLLDNAPSHPSRESLQSSDGKIKVMFLPPNTTSILQPMDQGVLEPCKRRYKRKLLRHIILENDSEDKSVPDILKAITMKDVVYWLAAAWQEASNDSLRKAWRNLLPELDPMLESEAEDDSDEVGDLVETAATLGAEVQDAVAEWMTADVNEPGNQTLDDEEIVAEMVASDGDREESDSEDLVAEAPITPAAAFDALDISLRWLESQNVEADHLMLVKTWRDKAARLRHESLKQTTITSYFAKL